MINGVELVVVASLTGPLSNGVLENESALGDGEGRDVVAGFVATRDGDDVGNGGFVGVEGWQLGCDGRWLRYGLFGR